MNTESTSNYVHSLNELKLMIANLETKVENLESKAENRALNENAEQKANYQALEAQANEFPKMLAEQKKQMMAQFQAQKKEAEHRAQMEKNEFEETIKQQVEKFRKEMDEQGKQAIGNYQMKLDYMWSQLMTKNQKILANPKGFVWNRAKSAASISECGLKATNRNKQSRCQGVIATEGYVISGEQCRKENFQFPGTIVFYYEVTVTKFGRYLSVGFTDGSKNPDCIGFTKFYYIGGCDQDARIDRLWLSTDEKMHKLECPIATTDGGAVVGCGLLLNSKNEWAVFFTVNGNLLGKQTPINPTVDRLYPMVKLPYEDTSLEANFGDNLVANPFKFDVDKCPGLVFE